MYVVVSKQSSKQTVKLALAVDLDVVVELLLATPPEWLVEVLYSIAARCIEKGVKTVAKSLSGSVVKRNGVYHVTLPSSVDTNTFINTVDETVFSCIRGKLERLR